MATGQEPPSAVTAMCPDCGEQTLHTVLHGRVGTRGATFTFEGTVECIECSRVHQATVKEPAPVEVPVVVSHGQTSHRTRIALPPDDDVSLGEAFIVEDKNCVLTGIHTKDLRWVDDAALREVDTLWMKEFEEIPIGFAINMGHKTITKTVVAKPEEEFTIGEERLFGRLRVTVHAIKTKERLLKRGTAEAGEIVRVFAKPTPLGGRQHRPDKDTRARLREKEERG